MSIIVKFSQSSLSRTIWHINVWLLLGPGKHGRNFQTNFVPLKINRNAFNASLLHTWQDKLTVQMLASSMLCSRTSVQRNEVSLSMTAIHSTLTYTEVNLHVYGKINFHVCLFLAMFFYNHCHSYIAVYLLEMYLLFP